MAPLLPLLLFQNLAAVPLVFRNTAARVPYMGSGACAGCHRSIYETYVRTAMGRSITKPGAELPSEAVPVRSESLNREFRVFRDNGELFQVESVQKDGQRVFEARHKLEYAIGSGENGISFAVRRGDYLFQAPLSYYAAAKKWDLSPGFAETGEGFGRPIYEACIVCHAGRPQAVPGREGLFRDPPFRELAIGCENCHGPGQLHIDEKIRGVRASPDTSIVNPARLPPRLAEDICMQCHQSGDARVLLPGKRYGDFRPGAPLVRTLAIIGLANKARQGDLLEHHESMKLSKCYRATDGKLSCLTCHNPHEQPGRLGAPQYFRAKCLGCHDQRSCRLDFAVRQRETPADNCIGCHMPKRNIERIAHAALTNHRIPVRPGISAASNPPVPSPDLPGLLLLDADAGEPPLPLLTRLAAYGELMARDPGLQPRYLELLERSSRFHPEDPLVLAALGRKAMAENNAEAIGLLTKAEEKGAPGAATYIDLSEALNRAGRDTESVAALERGEKNFPYSKPIRKHLVLAYIRQKAYSKARLALESYVQDFPEDDFMRGLLAQAPRGTQP